MCRTLVVSALALLSICPQAMADHIILKNGDRLSGNIAKMDGKKLVIKTDYAGEVAVTSDVIEQVESDRPLHIGLSDGQTIVGTVTSVADKLEVQTRDAGKVTVARGAIKTIRSEAEQDAYDAEIERYRNPGLLDLWNGSVQAGLALTRGNSETTNLALGVNAVRSTKRDKTSAYFTVAVRHKRNVGEFADNSQRNSRGCALRAEPDRPSLCLRFWRR